jgi:hypothetical protein
MFAATFAGNVTGRVKRPPSPVTNPAPKLTELWNWIIKFAATCMREGESASPTFAVGVPSRELPGAVELYVLVPAQRDAQRGVQKPRRRVFVVFQECPKRHRLRYGVGDGARPP